MQTTSIIQYGDLENIRKKHKDQKIVFCSGSFDLPHAGHVIFFEECKKLGDILVVGVGGDKIIRQNKGPGRPIMNEHVRLKMISSLKPVDYCLIDGNSGEEDSLSFVEFVFDHLRPNIYVVNTDAFDMPTRQELVKKYDVEIAVLERRAPKEFNEISATNIIKKIRGEDTFQI
jgi:D-beta-D-heptose 7-phosphate kinase / D-beta-D-heptose 1-phosphate adenosyltransferase